MCGWGWGELGKVGMNHGHSILANPSPTLPLQAGRQLAKCVQGGCPDHEPTRSPPLGHGICAELCYGLAPANLPLVCSIVAPVGCGNGGTCGSGAISERPQELSRSFEFTGSLLPVGALLGRVCS